ncbi:MAG: 4a-hydroxytetrahydrobiopterin dehydratase [Alphaproteobacteria bacterium]|nr:4a-hydroxytetrahydrobiopterin dehydratase [Alphaproteobacteria bacterium]
MGSCKHFPILSVEEIDENIKNLKGWHLENQKLNKKFTFDPKQKECFLKVKQFVDKICDVSEEIFHHPDIKFGWGYADISIWTHALSGLTEKDFLLAKKIDSLTN